MVEFLLHFTLTLEQFVHFVVGHFFGELGVDFFEFFEQIDGLLDGFFDNFAHRARIIDQRFLFQIADAVTRRENGRAINFLVHCRP